MARIQYQKGDIFDSSAQVIVNTVNCKGVMGKGLALAFKQRYPAMFTVYQQECKIGKLRIGRPTLYRESTPWILNFPTKDHWRFPSKLEYLEKGLEFLVANYKKAGIISIAFPKLGAQNGKLSWDDVGPLMAKYLSKLDIAVYVYITDDDKEYQVVDNASLKQDTQPSNNFNEMIWTQFNELAQFIGCLQQEVKLSEREAKKVAAKRAEMEFKSLADIQSIEKIADVSLKRIKDYINHQRCQEVELSGCTSTSIPHQEITKNVAKSSKLKRKKSKAPAAIQEESLFQVKEPAGKL